MTLTKRNLTKFPDTIPILGIPFEIQYPKVVKDEDGEELSGDCDVNHRRLRISTTENETEEQAESTLLHETIHGILGVSGVSALLEDKVEEAIVLALENGLSPLYQRKKG